MRRQRTIVGSPDESSSSPRHGSTRYDVRSTRSINSEETSFNNGSVIGHDDPTLVHTNTKGNSISRNEDHLIQNSHSGALDSFLTTTFSEEESRESRDTRRGNQSSSDYLLRQQLVELDQRQDAWRAKQQEASDDMDDMDDAGDFYLKEVGELSVLSPKKKSFVVLEETIYEEDELRENDVPEIASRKSSNRETVPVTYEKTEDSTDKINNEPSSQKKSNIEVKTVPYQMRQNRPQEDDAISELDEGQKEHSQEAVAKRVVDQNQRQRSEKDIGSSEQGKIKEVPTANAKARRVVSLDSSSDESVSSDFDFENNSWGEKFISNRNGEVEAIRMNSAGVDLSDQAINRAFVDIEDDTLFRNTRANDETKNTNDIVKSVQERLFDFSSNKKKEVPYATDSFDSSDHQKSAHIRSWLGRFSDHTRGESNDEDSDHQKSVRFRSWLTGRFSYHTRGESNDEDSDHQMSTQFRSWLPGRGSDLTREESNRNTLSGSQTLASKVDRSHDEDSDHRGSTRTRSWVPGSSSTNLTLGESNKDTLKNDEDDVDVKTGSRQERRKCKLFFLNVCIVLVIIASIVCTVLFALELRGPRSGDPSSIDENNGNQTKTIESESNEIPGEFVPDETYHEDSSSLNETVEGLPIESQATLSSPSDSPSETSFQTSSRITPPELLPTESPTKRQTPTAAPTRYLGLVEEKIRKISGESIDDVSSPAHDAYDWLISEDSASLDFDSVTEQDLSQRYIAALLYFSLDGGNWFEQYRFLKETHVCEWNNGSSRNKMGIICDSSDKITGFAINENNLRGQLPGELNELTDMTLFQFRANHIGGTIPTGFTKLSGLEEIDLRQNELVGTIPEEIFNLPQIKRLLLLRNSQLYGTIPATIEKASNLEMLSFQKCHITGSIPSTIGNLSKLFFFTFMENLLTGSIPESVTKLSKLEVLELSGNQLTGSIPELANHNQLYFLSVFDNKLKGTIPASLGILPKLMFLDIRNNQLDGTIPPSIGRLPDLVTFFAQNNRLTGNLPSFSSNKGLLQAIHLSDNKLSGNLDSLFGPDGPNERLVTVDLSQNNFIGSIPASIGLFDSLTELDLKGNSLSGTIPKEIGLLREMDTLSLQENDFSGTLPEEFGLMEQLIYLNVASNRFEGTIPDTLVLLLRLKVLDMNSNQLVGSVPTTFGQLSSLDELYLNNNYLTGDLTDTFCTGYKFGSSFKYIETFAADCLEPSPVVTCKCCTVCCKDDDCLTVPNLSGK